jgi:hypothetical protein
MAGFVMYGSVSADINQCELTFDGFGFMAEECNQARAISALGFFAMLGGLVLLIVSLITFVVPAKPASEEQTVRLLVGEDGSSVVSTQSETAFCNKCGNQYSLKTPDSNFCPKCGNPLTH